MDSPIVILDAFEVGQLYVALDKNIGKLSPELRKKLKDSFEKSRTQTVEVRPVETAPDAYHYATEEPA